MASKHVDVTFDIDFDTSKVTSGVSELERRLSELKSNYKDALKVGDASGINNIATKLKELNQEATKVKETLGSFSDNENINIQLQSNVSDLQSQMNSFANTMTADTTTRMSSGIKSVTDKMYSFAKTALGKTLSYGKTVVTTGFNFAKTATTSWLSFMKSGLSSILGVWKGILSKITSSGKSSVSSIGSQLKSIMGYASLAAVAALAKKSIDLGSSLFELQNVTDTVFGKMSNSIDEWSKNTASSFGLTEIQAKKMTGVFGGMLQASNIVESTSAKMSENLSALAGDLASFYNMDVSDTYEKLQSGLSGEVKAMRSFGVNMTVANLEAYALSQGITQSYKSMNQATQTTLRYNYMLSTLSKTQGDFARTQASWANQTRILANNFKQLLAIIGAGLIKVLYPTLVVLNKILSLAIQGANALAKMFGFTSKDLSSIYGSSNAQTATSDADDYADSLTGVSDATDDVADSTKKANSNLQSFDKLNNISSETNDSKSSGLGKGLGGLGLGSSIEPIDYADVLGLNDDVKIPAWLQAIVDFIKKAFKDLSSIDLSNLKAAWAEFAKAFGVIIKDIGKAIEWLWHNVLFPFIRWSDEQGIPAVLEFFAAGLRALHKVIEVVAPVIDNFWKKSLAPYFNAKGEAFVNMMHRWGDALDGWCKGLDESGDKLQYIKDTFTKMVFKVTAYFDVPDLTKQVNTLREKLKDSLNVVFDIKFNDNGEITQLFNKNTLEYIKQVAGLFLDISLITFNNILDVFSWFVGNMGILNFLEKVVALVGELADITVTHAESIADKIAVDPKSVEALTNIKDVISDILDFIDRNTPRLVEFFDVITEHLKSIADYLNQDGTGDVLLDDLLTTLENIANWFDDNKDKIVGALKLAGDAAKLLSNHLGLVLGALVAINAFKFGASILNVLNMLNNVFGKGVAGGKLVEAIGSAGTSAAGEVAAAGKSAASVVTAAGTAGAAAIASAAAILGTFIAGLIAAKDDINKAKDEASRESKFTNYTSKDKTNSLMSDGGKLFNTSNVTEYASKLNQVTEAYNKMGYSAKVISQGSSWSNLVSVNAAKQDLEGYIEELKKVGYTNQDNMSTLQALIDQNVGMLDRADWANSVNDVMTSIQNEVSTEATSISGATDAEFAKISLKAQDSGKASAINWVNGYKNSGSTLDLSLISYNDLVSQFGIEGASAAQELLTQMGLTLESSSGSIAPKAAATADEFVAGINAKSADVTASGNNMMQQFNAGLGSGVSIASDAAGKLVNAVSSGVVTGSSSCVSSGTMFALNLANGITSGMPLAVSAANTMSSGISSVLSSVTPRMIATGIGWITSLASGLSQATPLMSAVTSLISNAESVLHTGYPRMNSSGEYLTEGVANGMQSKSAMSSLGNAVSNLVSNLTNLFTSKCQIHSPSRLFAGLAEYIPEGVAVGINNGASSATTAISSLVDDMTSGFDSASINSTSFLDDTKFSDFFSTVSDDAKTFASGLSDTLSGIGFGGINTGDMLGKVSDLTGMSVNASVASSQESSNSAVSSLLSNISSASNSRGGNSNGKVYATIYLDANNELGKFIIDTVNGNVVTTGGF